MDTSLILSTTFIAFVSVLFVSGLRALLPKIDGKVLVGLCVLAVGVGLSFLIGGLGWRETIIRGLLAGAGAFGAASTWKWGTSKLPLSEDSLGRLVQAVAKAQEKANAAFAAMMPQPPEPKPDVEPDATPAEPPKEPDDGAKGA